MVLVLLLAWLVLSVLFAALFSFLARRFPPETRDWEGELREFLAEGATPPSPATVGAPPASDGAGRWRAPSPRQGSPGVAEFRG